MIANSIFFWYIRATQMSIFIPLSWKESGAEGGY